MIRAIRIEGLGPIKNPRVFDLGGLGVSRVVGPSEAGKTLTMIDATTFVLWGQDQRGRAFPVEAVNDDCDVVGVQIELVSGLRILREMRRSNRKTLRQIQGPDGTKEFPLEDAFQLELGPLGADHELLRTIMVPFAWVPLSLTNARPLRDLLARVMPPTDLRAVVLELMTGRGVALQDRDPLLEPEAVEVRRVQNNKVEHAATELEVAGRILQEEEAIVLTEPEMDRATAETIAETERQWIAYAASQQSRERWEAWQQRREALGPKPKKGAPGNTYSGVASLEEELKEAMVQHAALRDAPFPGDERLAAYKEDLRDKVNTLAIAPLNDVCPTCNRKGWTKAKNARESAQIAADDAARAYDQALEEVGPWRERWDADRKDELGAAETAVREAHEALKAARAEWESQRTEDPTAAWEKAFRALGPEPVQLGGVDNPPERPRPEPQRTLEALAARKAWSEYDGAVRASETAAFRNRKRVEDAGHELARVKMEGDRLEQLVQCVRLAPSIIADEQREILGDLGPVTIRFGRDPAVEILVDGRPYFLASTGKKLLADVYLRNAIRRASGMDWLPIFVDNTQDWSGELPEVAPMIEIRTSSDPLTVEIA